MLPAPEIHCLTVPAAPEPAPPSPFPWVATAAPVAMALVLFAVTRTPYTLMFAALGPLVAVGAAFDGRRSRGRMARRAAAQAAEQVARLVEQAADAQRHEGERLLRLGGAAEAPTWHGVPTGPVPVRVGVGRVASVVELLGVELSGVELIGADLDDERLGMLRAAAADPRDGPVVVDAADGIAIVGPPVLARSVARSIAVQVAAQLSPEHAGLTAPPDEVWARGLPHAVTPSDDVGCFVWSGGAGPIAWADDDTSVPAECRVRIDAVAGAVRGPGVVEQSAGFGIIGVSTAEASVAAGSLAEVAATRGIAAPGAGLPVRVALTDVLSDAPRPGLAAPIGCDARGPVIVDLVADGPHALVAGTTGSGKSELLVSWILSLAHGRGTDALSFLLIDFKGGASFAPLAALPHVVGTLSDLDPRLTRRAIQSLRAELLRRERVLAEQRVRSIDDLPAGRLARLIIVVDEFAALVGASPDLHDVFADLAARGRSLGLHLVLCTQRPAGVIRDSVLANVGLRLCLRVTDRADSIAMVGDDAAALLPVEPRGRAILRHDGQGRTLQVAVSAPLDAERIAGAGPAGIRSRPWLDPLPRDLSADDLPALRDGAGIPFGLLDLPAEQRQPPAVYDPERHGHLLVLGAAGAGATTALATLAAATGSGVLVLASEPADAWTQLGDLDHVPLLMIDGLDALIAAAGPELGHDLIERLSSLLRAGPPRSPAIVATARRLGGPLAGLAGLFGSRLLLRSSSRDEHLLAGGAHDTFDPDLPPGAGTWRGDTVQVARSGGELPVPRVPTLPRVVIGADQVLAIVAARPAAVADGLSGVRVVRLGHGAIAAEEVAVVAGGRPTVLIGDPDAWQAEWSLLTTARRTWPIVLIGCSPSDHRALVREPQPPPPLGRDARECWLVREGTTARALLDGASARESEENRPPNR